MLKEYDFKIEHVMPNDCNTDKPGPNTFQNGLIKISWNENVSPVPIITHFRTGNVVQNNVWLTNLSSGENRFSFSVGESCDWLYDKYLCCCSVTEDYVIDESDTNLCENVRDGIDFKISIEDVVGASSRTTQDGSIRVSVTSPGPDWSITWTSSRRENRNVVFRGTYLTDLYSGEYCYTYKDDCNTSGTTGCIVVDDCGQVVRIRDIIDVTPSCYGSTEGNIYFELATTGSILNEFTIHSILFDGTTGAELQNATTEITSNGTFISISDLNPCEHTFRVITEQYCEQDITITIPPQIDETKVAREICAYLYYCGGKLVRTDRVPLEEVPSEYCYITQLRCPITGELTEPENTFNEDLVSFYSVNEEAGTCFLAYPCEDGRIDGTLVSVILDKDCGGSGFDDIPTLSIGTVCKLNSPEKFDIPFDVGLSSETVYGTRAGSSSGSCSGGCLYPYEVNNPHTNEVIKFECCKRCFARPYPLVPLTISGLDECLSSENAQLVSSGTGVTISLSYDEVVKLVFALKNTGSVNSSILNFNLTPGLYFLITSKCEPLNVVII